MLLRIGYTLGVIICVPFIALYSASTGIVGAVEGGLLLIWDAWK